MAANRIGQLYKYTGQGSIPLWEAIPLLEDVNSFFYNELGRIEANIPFLILEKYEDAPRHEYWIKVLVEDKVGWVKSTYLNIDWVDPEEYV